MRRLALILAFCLAPGLALASVDGRCCSQLITRGGGGGTTPDLGSPPAVAYGCYTGDSIDDRTIDIGFQPSVVFVVEDAPPAGNTNTAMYRIADMDDGIGCALASNSWSGTGSSETGCGLDNIQSFVPAGFVVGGNVSVNSNTRVYCYLAFAAKDGFLEYGSYTGTGVNPTSIDATFAPDIVWNHDDAVSGCGNFLRTSDWPTGLSRVFSTTCLENASLNGIKSFRDPTADPPGGFTVGTVNATGKLNISGDVNRWIAWNKDTSHISSWFDSGAYTGSGSGTINIQTQCTTIGAVIVNGADGTYACDAWRVVGEAYAQDIVTPPNTKQVVTNVGATSYFTVGGTSTSGCNHFGSTYMWTAFCSS